VANNREQKSADLTSEIESITAKAWCERNRTRTSGEPGRRVRTAARTAFFGTVLTHPRRIGATFALSGPASAFIVVIVIVFAASGSGRATNDIGSAHNATRCHTVLDHPSFVFLAFAIFSPGVALTVGVGNTEIACFLIGRTFRKTKGVSAVADRAARARTVSQHPFRVVIALIVYA